jgi:hypothetical protein
MRHDKSLHWPAAQLYQADQRHVKAQPQLA